MKFLSSVEKVIRKVASLLICGRSPQNDVSAQFTAAQHGDLRCRLRWFGGSVVFQTDAARSLDARGNGFRQLIFYVIVILLNRIHPVVLAERLEQEMREVAVLVGRSFKGKLFFLARGENRPADALADAVEHGARRREIGEARGSLLRGGHRAGAVAGIEENHG